MIEGRATTPAPGFFAARVLLLLATLLPSAACSATRPTADADTYAAEGIWVRHLRIRLAPADTGPFEAMMKLCVQAAQTAELAWEYVWLCYREPPGRYWLIFFSETKEGFRMPGELDGFVDRIARAESEAARDEVQRMLAGLERETEWSILFQQKASWSTVDEMSATTHPMARIMDRTIRPGREADFDAALAARTSFFVEHGYPLPVEGFATRAGAPGRALQVVFPVDWSSFHAWDSFFAFVQNLGPEAREDYAARKAALMATMSRAEYFDGSFVEELSYRLP